MDPESTRERRRDDRLDSWKEIAVYLNRAVRTVQRWARKAGLPVHRLATEKRGAIYAYRSEIDAWWDHRSSSLAADRERVELADPIRPMLRVRVLTTVASTVLVIAAALWILLPSRRLEITAARRL